MNDPPESWILHPYPRIIFPVADLDFEDPITKSSFAGGREINPVVIEFTPSCIQMNSGFRYHIFR